MRVNHPLFLFDFKETLIFSTEFRKVLKYQILCNSVQWEPSCSMWTDGQTEGHDEANGRFPQFFECV
jgi:hypothetical protein